MLNNQTDNWSLPTFGPKTQRLFIYCEKRQRKAENLHIQEAGTNIYTIFEVFS